jgi:hypothetical protein
MVSRKLRIAVLCIGLMAAAFSGCAARRAPSPIAVTTAFLPAEAVMVDGYDGHAMEPFLSRDGTLLFFNNRNDPADQTELHVARRISDLHFAYVGPVEGANSSGLDGVASMDRTGHFYFISTRDYDATGNTLWTGRWTGRAVSGVTPMATDFTPRRLLRLNIDMEISADGDTLYVAENRWDLLRNALASSDIAMARRVSGRFERLANSDALLARINTGALEFAPSTSADERTLYFTRLNMRAFRRGDANAFMTFVSTRRDRTMPWGEPRRIAAITGHAEAPTSSVDGCALYFHQLVDGRFRLFRTQRRNVPVGGNGCGSINFGEG